MFRKLLEKSPLNKRVVLGATCLNPSLMLNETLRENRIKIAIEEFVAHNQLTPAEGDVILRSYMRFCENTHVKEKLQQFNWNKVRLDTLFGEIFHELKDDEIVPKLKRFIQLILVCFHGNAAVKRSFSFNKNFLIENLEENSLVAQRHLHNHICSLPEGLSSLEVNRKMLVEFRNASSRRVEALKKKKDSEEVYQQERKRAAAEIKALQVKRQKLLEEKSLEISVIDQKLKFLKTKKQ